MTKENLEQNNKNKLKSGLYLSLPFVLSVLAIILLSIWAYHGVIENNSFFRLLINKNITENDDRSTLYKILPDPEWTDDVLNSPDDMIEIPEVMPTIHYGQKWGTFNLEKYNFYNRPIYNSDNTSVFGNGVGRAFYAYLPGQGKSIVLSGHCTASFIYLENLEPGDIIKIKTIYGVYLYEVQKLVVFGADDASYVDAQYDEETLTCYTCYPYRTTLPRTQRIAVISKKVSGPDYRFDERTGNWLLVSGE